MKPEKSNRGKYAFNINEIKIKKKFQGSLKDFQKLNRGTYDEIESNDISIKESKAKLKKLKNSAVKEFVYTNKEIPEHWKTKLDYEQNLLKMFVKDKDFLFYLGHGGGGDNLRSLKEIEKNNSPRFNILNKSPKQKKEFPKINNNITTTSPVKASSNKHIVRNIRFKENNNISDKEILAILDEFKNAYPLFEKEKNLESYNIRDNFSNDTDRKSKTLYDPKHLRNSMSQNNNNYINNKKNVSVDIHSLNNFPTVKQKHNKRQITFRQNIFTSLLPSDDKYGKNFGKTLSGFNSSSNFRKKKIDFQRRNNNNIYLNSDYDFFNKKIYINNPTILKYLEGINNFGPYFSYCPPCGNRNLEFYKNLEPNQCLQIIQQIKKNKGKNIIVNNSKKKENNQIKQNEQINKNNSQEIKDKSKYNSKSIINNYNKNDSDNTSMIQQMSVGSDDREKLDLFD